MRYFNSIEIVEMNYNSWYSNSTVWPQRTEFIARLQCTVLSDGNVIQKHWKSSFYSFSFSFCTGFGNYFSVPHFLLLAALSFLPSFHCPPFPSPLPLSFLPFLVGISSSLSLSLSLFILLNFVPLNMNYLRAITTWVWCVHVALYLMLPTVLIRPHLLINQC